MTTRERARFALDIIEGNTPLPKLSNQQIASVCSVSIATVNRLKHKRDVTDAEIDRFIAQAGAERVFAALDRLTQPQFAVAAE
jgi:hypothetical protein